MSIIYRESRNRSSAADIPGCPYGDLSLIGGRPVCTLLACRYRSDVDGGGWRYRERQNRLFITLRNLLPDTEDAMHVFQAAKNTVCFLITTDHRTLIRFSGDIERLCGVTVQPSSKHTLHWCEL